MNLYCRMYFTDYCVSVCHSEQELPMKTRHERELFETMRLPFLDFFMREKCRTIEKLRRTRLKDHGEMVPGKKMEPPKKSPLPLDVYLAYLNRIEGKEIKAVSTVSDPIKKYKNMLHLLLAPPRPRED